jgi:hypothetical protein
MAAGGFTGADDLASGTMEAVLDDTITILDSESLPAALACRRARRDAHHILPDATGVLKTVV